MQPNEYQVLAARTGNGTESFKGRMSLCAIGVAGEAAELAECFERIVLTSEWAFDPVLVAKEAGDLCWYIGEALTANNQHFADLLHDARYEIDARGRGQTAMHRFEDAREDVYRLMTCAGKFADYLKKIAHHDVAIDEVRMYRLLVPVAQHLLSLLAVSDLKLPDIMQLNIDKLRKRYPTGFNSADSQIRRDEA